MFYTKTPTNIAIISLFIFFTIFLIIFYVSNPSWIQTKDKKTGEYHINWVLTVLYSITFSILSSIIIFLSIVSTGSNKTVVIEQKPKQDTTMLFPVPMVALTYGTSQAY